MSYVKNYDVGQIKLDLPYANYIHELPLLSFGDVRHTVNLSLVYNSANSGENAFNIANGFKLNLQKQIKFTGSTPTEFVDENGKSVTILNNGGVYTFDDESQRIIRKVGTTYELEYPDFSKEKYNSDGYITAVVDKYGDEFVTFTYSSNKLTAITYGNKVISLVYTSNRLGSIVYKKGTPTVCTTQITINGNVLTVTHYSGVVYTLNTTSGYIASAGDNASSAKRSLTVSHSGQNITVTDINNKSVTYHFHDSVTATVANTMIDVTDDKGVTTRLQYKNRKIMYAYEIINGGPSFLGNVPTSNHAGSVQIAHLEKEGGCKDASIVMSYINGYRLNNGNNNSWTKSDVTTSGYDKNLVLTGWVRLENTANETTIPLQVSGANNEGFRKKFNLYIPRKEVWTFFAYKFKSDNVGVTTNFDLENLNITNNDITTRDFRVSVLDITEIEKDGFISYSEDMFVIDGSSNSTYTSMQNAAFTHTGYDADNDNIYLSDIIRYRANQARGENTGELYCNNCKKIINIGSETTNVNCNETVYALSDLNIAKVSYTKNKATEERISFYKYANEDRVKIESKGITGGIIATNVYDSNFDLISTTKDGITTNYTRNAQGLVETEEVSGLYRYKTTYTDSLITVTEYDPNTGSSLYSTKYNLDTTWGGVKSVEYPDGSKVTDVYDDDMKTLTKVKFDNLTNGRSNNIGYSNGYVSSMSTGALDYAFEHTAGKLTRVSKDEASFEQHNHNEAENKITSGYPAISGALYSKVTHFDKYGRLTEVEGELENTYDIDPEFDSNGALIAKYSGSGAKLAMSKDIITGNTTRYEYNEDGLLDRVTCSDSDDYGDVINTSLISYDNIDRLQTIAFWTDNNTRFVSDSIEYFKPDTDPTADNKIKKYTFAAGESINGVVSAKGCLTENVYDDFNRIEKKSHTFDGGVFTKNISFTRTRPTTLTDKYNDTQLGNTTYAYDPVGRIKTITVGGKTIEYTYDEYGQLEKEVNNVLDKTIEYEYNEIGNIASVTTTPTGGTATTTTFTYGDSTHPDRLTAFNGKLISYNSMGCVTNYDGKNYTWRRGKLGGFTRGSSTQAGSLYESFTANYDALGRRTSKNYVYDPNPASTSDYSYTYNTKYTYDHSGRLVREVITERYVSGSVMTRELVYLYDESSMIGCVYSVNDTVKGTYYYQRNLLGDVVAIYDIAGTKITEYAYDAYGNCTFTYGYGNEFSRINPIRYRGYYLDRETNLYYLNARYYNPEWRRFLSPDDSSYLDPQNVNGLNLYAYCYNDPVNYCDPSGHEAEWYNILGWIGLGLVVAAATVLTMGTLGIAVGGAGLLGAVIHGAATGALIGAGIGVIGGAVGGIIYDAVAGNEFGLSVWAGVQAGLGIGAIVGMAVGGYTGYATFHGHSVYISTSDGTVNYVGRTNDIARRTLEHANAGRGIVPQEVASKLTLKQARGLEQALINKYKMIKNGGTLLNRINSIATSNPIYNKAVAWGNMYIKLHPWKFI